MKTWNWAFYIPGAESVSAKLEDNDMIEFELPFHRPRMACESPYEMTCSTARYSSIDDSKDVIVCVAAVSHLKVFARRIPLSLILCLFG